MSRLARYVWNNLIAVDQLANALTGGEYDETISERAQALRECGAIGWYLLAGLLDTIHPNHCALAVEHRLARARRKLGLA